MLRHAGSWFGIAQPSAGIDPDWLVGMAEQLVADAGLIGVPRSELMAILEQRAAAAAAGRLRYLPGEAAPAAGAAGAPSILSGLSAATTFYDLLRATHEALGREARACYAALGPPPREIRISERGGLEPACPRDPRRLSRVLPSGRSGAPRPPPRAPRSPPRWRSASIRIRTRPRPTGSPLISARRSRSTRRSGRSTPRRHEAEGPAAGRQPAQIALAPLSIGRIAPVTLRASSDAR